MDLLAADDLGHGVEGLAGRDPALSAEEEGVGVEHERISAGRRHHGKIDARLRRMEIEYEDEPAAHERKDLRGFVGD